MTISAWKFRQSLCQKFDSLSIKSQLDDKLTDAFQQPGYIGQRDLSEMTFSESGIVEDYVVDFMFDRFVTGMSFNYLGRIILYL